MTKKCGGAGYRSLCLMHAKHALYHLSYTPNYKIVQLKQNQLVNLAHLEKEATLGWLSW